MPDATPAAPERCAVVLAGAGTHGAFEAGALEVMIRAGHRCSTVVGASAGSLNGALFASATRAGKELELADDIGQIWLERTGLFDVFSPSLAGIVHLRGLSTSDKLIDELVQLGGKYPPGAQQRVRAVFVVAALQGQPAEVAGRPATSYERPVTFADADFDTPESRAAVYRAAVASGAIPVVFVPVELPGVGPCADGGLVNNAPIKHALADPAVDRVYVIVPYPSPIAPPPPQSGLALVAHAFDIFIQERLLRDLRECVDTNRQLAALEAQNAPPALRQSLGLAGKRQVEIVQIRPPQSFPGNELSGFGNMDKVKALLDAGRAAAKEALAAEPIRL